METNKRLFIFAAIGAAVVLAILVMGTVWAGHMANDDNDKAVNTVSLFYLDELAARREQVVSTNLHNYKSDMDTALGLMTKEDFDTVEHLQAYQSKMKQLYKLEKFAFVDEEGIIYTSRGTRKDIDAYPFDPKELNEVSVFVKDPAGDDKKVVIAAPVDRLPFAGKHLIVCFAEIDMSTMLSGISLQSGDTATFCNIYTHDGISLTNAVLGGLASEDNLLEAMQHAEFKDGYSLDKMKSDYEKGVTGAVSFTYNDITETLYYVPVHGTDWMLTYLVRESVISDQIDSISKGTIKRNLIISVLTTIFLILIFIIVLVQNRRGAKLALEKEINETENRVRQEELEEQMAMQEEQMAMQEELLEQEKYRAQQDRMITALASDYRSVYYVDLDLDSATCYRESRRGDHPFSEGEDFPFHTEFEKYANEYVDEKYREGFLKFIDKNNIRERLTHEVLIAYRYLVHRNGEDTYEMLRMAGVRHIEDRDDHIVHAVGVGFTDIDEDMRDSLAKSNALNDALNSAEKASKAKTQFLSRMSHEIRTPMNAIIGLDNLALQEEGLSDTTKDYLEKIGSSADHLLSLINDILDMSRIESGHMTLKKEEFSLPKLIEQICTLFSSQCREKGLTFNCNIHDQLNECYIGDDMKLRQVLINILSNAVKFTPEGGKVDFEVEKTASFDKNTTLRFTIRDSGVGISEEYLPKIFEVFSQEDENTTNKYGSTGLGMAITKNIVDMMNGDINVESEKGKGTTFTVTITLSDCDRKITKDDDKKEETKRAQVDLAGKRILLAEDVEINAQIMTQLLKMKDMEVDLATNGVEVLEKYKSSEKGLYAAILMDIRMPEMDGIEAATKIRALDREDAKEIPIIALTANAFDEDVQRSLQAGMNAHLSKPIDPDALYKTLEECVCQ